MAPLAARAPPMVRLEGGVHQELRRRTKAKNRPSCWFVGSTTSKKWQTSDGQYRNRVEFMVLTPNQWHVGCQFVYWGKGCGTGGTTVSCTCTKVGAKSPMIQHIAQGKQC